jgi:hypothetical protein
MDVSVKWGENKIELILVEKEKPHHIFKSRGITCE